MEWVLGSKLTPKCQITCLQVFRHRYTGEHRPAWAMEQPYTGHPHFKDDAEWLNNTTFAITKSGKLSMRHNHCESTPTFPYGKPQFPY